ncbi:MAG TPA: RNA 2',3'-cyclic phosphodiesterase [Thermoanaerobaculia bacterium]
MRLFIATTFPRDVLADVNDRIARVRSKLAAASWVRPETQHLTFAFLGDQDDSLVDALAPRVEERLVSAKKFEARLNGSGFFPNPRHARVAWVGVTPPEAFIGVADGVRAAVKDAGVELDNAEFKPHLTLCRIRDRWPPACVEAFNGALRDYESAPFTVDRVTLFSSRLDPSGAVHTPLREMRLS